jgi:hypothetical protein
VGTPQYFEQIAYYPRVDFSFEKGRLTLQGQGKEMGQSDIFWRHSEKGQGCPEIHDQFPSGLGCQCQSVDLLTA